MKDKKNIIWLASYPKSGNTWFRVFLTNLLSNSDKPADINNLYPTTIASSRSLFDEATGIPSSDLTQDEIEKLRPRVYRYMSETSDEIIYHKIHDAWIKLSEETDLVPDDVTKGVLYFIRNPLDVAVSFAHHSATSIDRAIDMMNNHDFAFCSRETKLHNQTRQRLLTWSEHVESWIDQSGLPVMILRYEDMLTDTFSLFKQAVKFMHLPATDTKIKRALEFSSFKIVSNQEKDQGKSCKIGKFFSQRHIRRLEKYADQKTD